MGSDSYREVLQIPKFLGIAFLHKMEVSELKLTADFQRPGGGIKLSPLGQFHCLNILPTELPWMVIHGLQHSMELYHEAGYALAEHNLVHEPFLLLVSHISAV